MAKKSKDGLESGVRSPEEQGASGPEAEAVVNESLATDPALVERYDRCYFAVLTGAVAHYGASVADSEVLQELVHRTALHSLVTEKARHASLFELIL